MKVTNAMKEAAAVMAEEIRNPTTHIVQRQAHYSVPLGASPGSIVFNGTTSRLAVKFDSGSAGIGSIPYKIDIPYKRVGNPNGTLKVGIRKAAGDTFQLIAEWPIEKLGQPWITTGGGGGPNAIQFIHISVQGGNEYAMLANDKISLEFPPDATNTIEIGTGTGLPAGFTSQQYTGSYTNTAQPLAISITSKVLVPV